MAKQILHCPLFIVYTPPQPPPVFEILTWSSDRHAAFPQASPCSADRTGFPSTIPQAAGMNTDEIRPLGSWLEDDEDTVLPVLLQSDSPHPLLFLLGSMTLWKLGSRLV